MPLSPELLGRIFDGSGRPIDGLGDIFRWNAGHQRHRHQPGVPGVSPKLHRTGISSIDCMMTLIRGQKLPIFSGSGMRHNELAAQIVRQAKIA